MKKIVLTSINPVKISAVEKVTKSLYGNQEFEYIPLPLEKDGPEPIGREYILKQIQEALDSAKVQVPDAEYYACMEGGMELFDEEMHETAYAVVMNRNGQKGISGCATFRVPTWVAGEVKKGRGFADAVDEFYKTQGTKLGGGFVKILTDGSLNKEDHYMQALTIAFASVDKGEWYV